jgi:hypothetical protein
MGNMGCCEGRPKEAGKHHRQKRLLSAIACAKDETNALYKIFRDIDKDHSGNINK